MTPMVLREEILVVEYNQKKVSISVINSLTTVGYLLEVFIKLLDTFHGPHFHFCLDVPLET